MRKEISGSASTNMQNPWLALIVLCIAQFMILLDFSIINVALPSLQHAFALSPQDLQWIVSAYALLFGGFLLLGGRAADLLGRRRIFTIGLLLFTVASLIGGLAQSGAILIAARGVQGFGAALLSPAAFSLLTTNFAEGPERNRALGIWGTLAAVGFVAGVLLGGVITAELGWRWIFFINVPVGLVAMVLALFWIQESRDTIMKREIDIVGAVVVTIGLMALVYTIVGINDLSTQLRFLSAAVALVFLIAFVVVEARVREPLIPLNFLGRRSLLTTNGAMLLQAIAAGTQAFIMTLYLQDVLGYSALQTGLSFLPLGIAGVFGGPIAFQLASRIGARVTAAIGLAIDCLGLLLLSQISTQSGFLVNIMPGMILFGFGVVMTIVSLTIATSTGINNENQGLVGGLFNTSQQVGTGLGLAMATAISTARIMSLGGFADKQHLVGGYQLVLLVTTGLIFIGIFIALAIPAGVVHRSDAVVSKEDELVGKNI